MILAKMRNFPKRRELFQKNSMHEENYMAKPCIAKKIFTLISKNCKNSVKSL